jgi:hypothetical protein
LTFRRGEAVRITFHDHTVDGEVLMASENGLSMTLLFDGSLGGYHKFMPVLWMEDSFVDLLLAHPVLISPICE